VADARAIVYGQPNGLDYSRLGLSVGRKFGKAVARSRFRRLCREVFRCHRQHLPKGWDFVVIPRPGTMPTHPQIHQSLLSLMARVIRKKSRSTDT